MFMKLLKLMKLMKFVDKLKPKNHQNSDLTKSKFRDTTLENIVLNYKVPSCASVSQRIIS